MAKTIGSLAIDFNISAVRAPLAETFCGQALLVVVHTVGAPFVDDALGVTEDDIVLVDTHGDGEVGAGDSGCAGAVYYDLGLFDILADDFKGVKHAGGRDDRGAVLVVVEDRYVHDLLELFFNVEAFRALDVLEVDAAKSRFKKFDCANQFVRIFGVQLDIEDVDISKAFEENAFPFHDRFASQSTYVAEAENCCAV
jgi:hypothetical protein